MSVEGVIPETFVRVQTGHEGLTLKVPSLVSLLWVLTTSWSCSPQGSDSAQDSDVPLAVPKGETLEGLDWKGDGAEGTHWTAGIFEWDMWAYGGLWRMSALA